MSVFRFEDSSYGLRRIFSVCAKNDIGLALNEVIYILYNEIYLDKFLEFRPNATNVYIIDVCAGT